MVDDTVILIGPMMAGKSTVGRLLSERLGLPQFVLDDLRWDYFNEIGCDNVSVAILNERMEALLREHEQPEERIPEVLKANEEFVRHPANGRLAKRVVYTEGKTPEETCIEIVKEMGLMANGGLVC